MKREGRRKIVGLSFFGSECEKEIASLRSQRFSVRERGRFFRLREDPEKKTAGKVPQPRLFACFQGGNVIIYYYGDRGLFIKEPPRREKGFFGNGPLQGRRCRRAVAMRRCPFRNRQSRCRVCPLCGPRRGQPFSAQERFLPSPKGGARRKVFGQRNLRGRIKRIRCGTVGILPMVRKNFRVR